MKVSYYPGCSLEETAQAYDVSARQVCQHLGIDLEEIPEWSCCGSSPALKMDHLLSTSLGAHNLAQAQRQQLEEQQEGEQVAGHRDANRGGDAEAEEAEETAEKEGKS